MASPAKKAKIVKTDTLPVCTYGASCYRKNPAHLKEFSHGTNSTNLTKADSVDRTPSPTPSPTTAGTSSDADDLVKKVQSTDVTKLPPCKYGSKCFRKNLLHFAEFSHSVEVTSDALKKAKGQSSTTEDNDTDDVDSDEETTGKLNTHLNRGLSLMKDFTCMSEKERRQLILRALEAKAALAEELSMTKQTVRNKMKQLRSLQKQVNQGTLQMSGEEAALKGDKIVYFPLLPERDFKENSAAQMHFRLAESQFYRLMTDGSSYRVTKVEYVVNPPLVRNFKTARDQLRTARGEDLSFPVLAFHGTDEANIEPICEAGFRTPEQSSFEHKTDTGWYGKGVYFSEYPAYSMDYIDGAEKLLLCQVLPGKVYQCTKLQHGSALQTNYDSHTSPDRKELVVFNSARILPQYVVHYTDEPLDAYSYSGNRVTRDVPSPADMKQLYDKAAACAKSTVFAEQRIQFSGVFSDSQKKMQDLVKLHGAKIGTKTAFDVLVTTSAEFCNKTAKNLTAISKSLPAVSEDFVYKSIIDKEPHDLQAYQFRKDSSS